VKTKGRGGAGKEMLLQRRLRREDTTLGLDG